MKIPRDLNRPSADGEVAMEKPDVADNAAPQGIQSETSGALDAVFLDDPEAILRSFLVSSDFVDSGAPWIRNLQIAVQKRLSGLVQTDDERKIHTKLLIDSQLESRKSEHPLAASHKRIIDACIQYEVAHASTLPPVPRMHLLHQGFHWKEEIPTISRHYLQPLQDILKLMQDETKGNRPHIRYRYPGYKNMTSRPFFAEIGLFQEVSDKKLTDDEKKLLEDVLIHLTDSCFKGWRTSFTKAVISSLGGIYHSRGIYLGGVQDLLRYPAVVGRRILEMIERESPDFGEFLTKADEYNYLAKMKDQEFKKYVESFKDDQQLEFRMLRIVAQAGQEIFAAFPEFREKLEAAKRTQIELKWREKVEACESLSVVEPDREERSRLLSDSEYTWKDLRVVSRSEGLIDCAYNLLEEKVRLEIEDVSADISSDFKREFEAALAKVSARLEPELQACYKRSLDLAKAERDDKQQEAVDNQEEKFRELEASVQERKIDQAQLQSFPVSFARAIVILGELGDHDFSYNLVCHLWSVDYLSTSKEEFEAYFKLLGACFNLTEEERLKAVWADMVVVRNKFVLETLRDFSNSSEEIAAQVGALENYDAKKTIAALLRYENGDEHTTKDMNEEALKILKNLFREVRIILEQKYAEAQKQESQIQMEARNKKVESLQLDFLNEQLEAKMDYLRDLYSLELGYDFSSFKSEASAHHTGSIGEISLGLRQRMAISLTLEQRVAQASHITLEAGDTVSEVAERSEIVDWVYPHEIGHAIDMQSGIVQRAVDENREEIDAVIDGNPSLNQEELEAVLKECVIDGIGFQLATEIGVSDPSLQSKPQRIARTATAFLAAMKIFRNNIDTVEKDAAPMALKNLVRFQACRANFVDAFENRGVIAARLDSEKRRLNKIKRQLEIYVAHTEGTIETLFKKCFDFGKNAELDRRI